MSVTLFQGSTIRVVRSTEGLERYSWVWVPLWVTEDMKQGGDAPQPCTAVTCHPGRSGSHRVPVKMVTEDDGLLLINTGQWKSLIIKYICCFLQYQCHCLSPYLSLILFVPFITLSMSSSYSSSYKLIPYCDHHQQNQQ